MKVLMFGWEFPPISSGGLGTACFGLTKALATNNVGITFVLPAMSKEAKHDFLKLIPAKGISKVRFKEIDTLLSAYITSEKYHDKIVHFKGSQDSTIYGQNLFQEVYKYSRRASLIASTEAHDIIHCHDWMTYRAGIEAKKVSHKPLVVHVHATEFDRTGGNPNQIIYELEREGMHEADHIISVSQYTKDKIVEHYGISPDKVSVVHNAVDFSDSPQAWWMKDTNDATKYVLFLGRITLQKGPDYFLYTAKKVLESDPNVRFLIAGSGDMQHYIIEKSAELGIGDKVLFTGFLQGDDIDKAYQMADLYVMPSVSEPFGITPLESMRNSTPVLISKQSGVSEVITHCLKADFWDIDDMTNKILCTLKYNSLKSTLTENGYNEVRKLSWNTPAKKCIDVYNRMLGTI